MKIFLVVLLVLLFFVARRARPAKNNSGTQIAPPHQWQTPKSEFSIATYNIQTGKNLAGKRDIKTTTALIHQPNADIIGLQEIYAPSWLNRLSIGRSQCQQLTQSGQYGWLFSATRLRWFREHRGNATLSRFKPVDWQTTMLPDESGKSYRNYTCLRFDICGTEVTIINTHLHTRQGRERQLEIVLAELDRYEHAILMGDFNTTRSDAILHSYLETNKHIVDAIQVADIEPQEHADQRIDWILTKGLSIKHGHWSPKGVSDHPYYQITVALAEKV